MGRNHDADETFRAVALLDRQGTACAETMLYDDEDTPERREEIERSYCLGGADDPVAGTWADVSENDYFHKP